MPRSRQAVPPPATNALPPSTRIAGTGTGIRAGSSASKAVAVPAEAVARTPARAQRPPTSVAATDSDVGGGEPAAFAAGQGAQAAPHPADHRGAQRDAPAGQQNLERPRAQAGGARAAPAW